VARKEFPKEMAKCKGDRTFVSGRHAINGQISPRPAAQDVGIAGYEARN